MDDVDEEQPNGQKNDKYKFAFVFISAALAVCCALLILLLVNRNARSEISVVNYNTVTTVRTGNLSLSENSSEAPDGKIDLNSCTAEQLCSIPGIGEKTAEKIIDYRNSAGGFDFVDELINIKGIGKGKLAKIRQYVTVEK